MTNLKILAVMCLGFAGLTVGQEEAPVPWFEDFEHADGSRTRTMSFETVPGVMYSVEYTDTLTNWIEEFEVYGLGQTHHVPMVWFEAPDGTPPPEPPEAGEASWPFVSLIMKNSTAPEGGAILSWRSLEDGTPLMTVVSVSPSAAWSICPISVHRYGGYQFFIMLTSAEGPPAGELASFGSLDQDMIDAFAASFAAMDLDMTNGHGTSGTAPELQATEPGAREFWRIHADWTVDSDFDGSPDWAELALMADPTHPSFPYANVMDSDKDGDGIPDGYIIDSDGDGIVDRDESSKTLDKVLDWTKLEQPRYAAFALVGPASENGEEPEYPHQINDMGVVLFDKGVWYKGEYHELVLESDTIEDCSALGMNNKGEIVGVGMPKNPSQGSGGGGTTVILPTLAWWDGYEGTPERVEIPAEDPDDVISSLNVWDSVLAGSAEDRIYDCLLDDDGHFVGISTGTNHGHHWSVWQRIKDENGVGSFVRMDAPADFVTYTLSPNITWGLENDQTKIFGSIDNPASLAGRAMRVARRPGGGLMAFFGKAPPMGERADDGWLRSNELKVGEDVAMNGVVLSRSFRLWLNDHTKAFADIAYGVEASWGDDPGFFDMSPAGWVAGRKVGGESMPMEVMAGMPVVLLDEDDGENFASGVDHHSANSHTPDVESQGRYWAMVPTGRDGDNNALSNAGRLLTPASAANPVTLTAPGVVFEPAVLNTPDQTVELTTTATATEDVDLTLALESVTAGSHPVGLKIMKKRVVKIQLWHIGLNKPDGSVVGPELKFTKELLEPYLNRVFGRQANTYWDVLPPRGLLAPDPVSWDIGDGPGFDMPEGEGPTPGNGVFDTGSEVPSPEQNLVANENRTNTSASINVYIVGGAEETYFSGWGPDKNGVVGFRVGGVKGITDPDGRKIWITGTYKNASEEEIEERTNDYLNTIAHEIGHVMLGPGHPNLRDWSRVHPLPDSPVDERLMFSLAMPNTPMPERRVMLVKGEWDEIEDWLVDEEIAGRIAP